MAQAKTKSKRKVNSAVNMMARVRQVESVAGFAKAKKQSLTDKLPFVGRRTTKPARDEAILPNDFWHNVKSTGNFEQDGDLGSRYAYLALQAIKAERFQPLLGWIVMDMIENKCPPSIVIGFFQTIADVCLRRHEIPPANMRLAGALSHGQAVRS